MILRENSWKIGVNMWEKNIWGKQDVVENGEFCFISVKRRGGRNFSRAVHFHGHKPPILRFQKISCARLAGGGPTTEPFAGLKKNWRQVTSEGANKRRESWGISSEFWGHRNKTNAQGVGLGRNPGNESWRTAETHG